MKLKGGTLEFGRQLAEQNSDETKQNIINRIEKIKRKCKNIRYSDHKRLVLYFKFNI